MPSNLLRMKAKLNIIRAGTYASIQDNGRNAHVQYGVPESGFIDKKAAQKLNKLLGNEINDAVLEWTQIGPQVQFTESSQIALSHTSPTTTLNGNRIRAQKIIEVPKNSLLNLGNNPNVIYAYLAIKKGFKTDRVLQSRSFQIGITPYDTIQTNEVLYYLPNKSKKSFFTKPSFELHQSFADNLARIIDCYKGPEYTLLNKQQQSELEQYFTLSNKRNRMGLQINEQVPNQIPTMLSVPIMPGTVQLTPSGKLIVLSKDCQTTGGYPRILHLSEKALAQLSQTLQNVRFRFNIIEYT